MSDPQHIATWEETTAKELTPEVRAHLEELERERTGGAIIGLEWTRPGGVADLVGIDAFGIYEDGRSPLRIDYKVRAESAYLPGIVLEVWSDIERRVPGWTLREDAQTQEVGFYYRRTRELVSYPFGLLHRTFRGNLEQWQTENLWRRTDQKWQRSDGSIALSEYIALHRMVLERAMRETQERDLP